MTAIEPSGPASASPPVIHRYSAPAAIMEIVREVSGARELIRELVRRDLRVRYKQAAFGFLWAVLMPVMIVMSGMLVRFAISQMTNSTFDTHMAAGLAVKSLAWGFFVGALNVATPSVLTNNTLVTKVHFPREVLPLSAILSAGTDSMVGATAFILISPFLGVHVSAGLLWVPVLILLLFCITLATGLLFSCANVFFRDVKYLVQLVLTFGIFFTPVFYEPAALGPKAETILMVNPVAPILEGLRLAVTEGHNLLVPLTVTASRGEVLVWTPWYLVYSATIGIGGLIVSSLIFHHAAGVYAEYV